MRKLFSILSIATVLLSCNKFDDINVAPTALSEPSSRGLLTNSIQSMPGLMMGGTAVSRNGSLYVQYLAEGPYPGPSLYNERTFSFATWYTGPLFNLQKIIQYNSEGAKFADPNVNGSKDNQIGVARILKAFYFLQMTDRWGDIPYSDALKGDQAFSPKYDKQQDIYTDLFKELKEAQAQIKTNESPVVGDVLLNGDMAAWKRFANTTRMIMALRLSKIDPAKGKTEFAAAVTDGAISSNSQNVSYKFIAGDPNNYNPWYNNYSVDNRNDYAISKTLTDYMDTKNDPRLKVYAENLAGGAVKGLQYGRNSAVNIPAAFSRIGSAFRSAGSSLNIYNYAQVLFMMAEAAKIGYITGGDATAATHYYDAIKASWEQYGVYDATAYASYIANPAIAYDPAKGYQLIMTEKWVHMYLNGWEAWNDWRRTGFPVLTQAVDAVDPRGIPRRLGYPTAEGSLNGDNYKAAVTAMGGDHNYIRVWWDKQ
jgi:hypothetical protein